MQRIIMLPGVFDLDDQAGLSHVKTKPVWVPKEGTEPQIMVNGQAEASVCRQVIPALVCIGEDGYECIHPQLGMHRSVKHWWILDQKRIDLEPFLAAQLVVLVLEFQPGGIARIGKGPVPPDAELPALVDAGHVLGKAPEFRGVIIDIVDLPVRKCLLEMGRVGDHQGVNQLGENTLHNKLFLKSQHRYTRLSWSHPG